MTKEELIQVCVLFQDRINKAYSAYTKEQKIEIQKAFFERSPYIKLVKEYSGEVCELEVWLVGEDSCQIVCIGSLRAYDIAEFTQESLCGLASKLISINNKINIAEEELDIEIIKNGTQDTREFKLKRVLEELETREYTAKLLNLQYEQERKRGKDSEDLQAIQKLRGFNADRAYEIETALDDCLDDLHEKEF